MNSLSQLITNKITLNALFSWARLAEPKPFSRDLLKLHCPREADRICAMMRQEVLRGFKKKGVVVGVSGGIDSSTVAALAVRALGPDRVLALLMPEKDSSADTLELSLLMANHLGITSIHD